MHTCIYPTHAVVKLPYDVRRKVQRYKSYITLYSTVLNVTVPTRTRCTPCLGKSDNKHLEKFCPGSPFEPSFSPSPWPAPLQHDPVSSARRLTCSPVA